MRERCAAADYFRVLVIVRVIVTRRRLYAAIRPITLLGLVFRGRDCSRSVYTVDLKFVKLYLAL